MKGRVNGTCAKATCRSDGEIFIRVTKRTERVNGTSLLFRWLGNHGRYIEANAVK